MHMNAALAGSGQARRHVAGPHVVARGRTAPGTGHRRIVVSLGAAIPVAEQARAPPSRLAGRDQLAPQAGEPRVRSGRARNDSQSALSIWFRLVPGRCLAA